MEEGAPVVAAMVRHCCNLIRSRMDRVDSPRGLVVGCGRGDEVVYIRRTFGTPQVIGIDLKPELSAIARAEHCVLIGDAERLPFRSESFDFATAFHSLEHVEDVNAALDEIHRVLRPGGWFYMGVPNKSRAVGYVGSFDATTWQKIVWNLADWKARLQGRFRNEAGAHAGFKRQELLTLLGERFSNVELLTEQFLRFKYGGRLPGLLLDLLLAPAVINYSAPSHYTLCQKPS
jgi:SAM-dependent methyltransferase